VIVMNRFEDVNVEGVERFSVSEDSSLPGWFGACFHRTLLRSQDWIGISKGRQKTEKLGSSAKVPFPLFILADNPIGESVTSVIFTVTWSPWIPWRHGSIWDSNRPKYLDLTLRSSLLIIQAELNGVPVSALIDSGAQWCFIAYEATVRVHPSGRKKIEANHSRTRGATEAIKGCFESFPEAVLILIGIRKYWRPLLLSSLMTWYLDKHGFTTRISCWLKEKNLDLNETKDHSWHCLKPLKLPAVNHWRHSAKWSRKRNELLCSHS
jgi:hypothetical protein